jgi:hypothetical protein
VSECPGCGQPVTGVWPCPQCGLPRDVAAQVHDARDRWAEASRLDARELLADLRRLQGQRDEIGTVPADVRERLALILADMERATADHRHA